MNIKRVWQDVTTLVLGIWLFISPLILPRSLGDDALFNNTLIVGLFVQIVAVAAIARPNAWKEWILVVLASWAIASSYLLDNGVLTEGFHFSLATSLFIVGLLIMIDASFGLYRRQAIRDMDKPVSI